MIRQIVAALAVMFFLVAFAGALWKDGEDRAEAVVQREVVPRAERAGEVEINNNTLYLWTFDVEGKRCLWVTTRTARDWTGGLTCWDRPSLGHQPLWMEP